MIQPDQIRVARVTLGYTLEEIAAKVGISVGYLAAIERFDRPLSNEIEKKIVQAFDVDWSTVVALLEVHDEMIKSRGTGGTDE